MIRSRVQHKVVQFAPQQRIVFVGFSAADCVHILQGNADKVCVETERKIQMRLPGIEPGVTQQRWCLLATRLSRQWTDDGVCTFNALVTAGGRGELLQIQAWPSC